MCYMLKSAQAAADTPGGGHAAADKAAAELKAEKDAASKVRRCRMTLD